MLPKWQFQKKKNEKQGDKRSNKCHVNYADRNLSPLSLPHVATPPRSTLLFMGVISSINNINSEYYFIPLNKILTINKIKINNIKATQTA